MIASIILVFILGYMAIVFEHPLKLDKTVPAMAMAVIMWSLVAFGFNSGILSVIDSHGEILNIVKTGSSNSTEHLQELFTNVLLHHMGKVAEILIFLIGAMTIVELVDAHKGFEVLKDYITTKNKKKLLWIIGIISFFLSAVIDNLTCTIVMVSLMRKLIKDRDSRLIYISMVVIAANAGGAWSPIGDVTTTMLWIGKKVSAVGLSEYLIIPSLVCFAIPFLIVSRWKECNGQIEEVSQDQNKSGKVLSSKTMLYLGLGMIVFVPIFKAITHLPPYLGMMLSLSVVWMVAEYIKPEENLTEETKKLYSPHRALARIELSSILFFLGILLAVAAMETAVIDGVGILRYAAEGLEKAIPNQDIVIILLGYMSAVIDNVPLVAASMGMFDLPMDNQLWHFIAYAAGTGGSMLIIGSAAGVAAMGMERIDFIWYLKNITLIAMAGYIGGALVFIAMHSL